MGEQRGDHRIFSRQIDLRSARFFVCYGSNRASLKTEGGAQILASFENGEPALVEGSFEKRGKVLLFASTADLAWSNLALRRAFLPWLYQMIYYMSNQDTTLQSYALKAPVPFQALAAHYKETISVTDPDGKTLVLAPTIKGSYAQAVYTATTRPGLYRVRANSAFTNSGGFGVNLNVAKESDLTMADPDAIMRAARPGLVRFIDTPGRSVVEEIKRSREGEELWPLLFKLALLVFIVESLFANFTSRAKKAGGMTAPLFEVLRQRKPGVE
jgi:hypothetical protein